MSKDDDVQDFSPLELVEPDNLYPWLKPAWDSFSSQLNADRIAHAMLLAGPKNSGKLALAQLMVASLLCQRQPVSAGLDFGEPDPAEQVAPCGECQSCRFYISGAHPDFRHVTFEINRKTGKLRTEIVVDQIRDLVAALVLTTTFSPQKVALIQPAESMNRNAANALLKTLEEPAGSTVFILVSSEPARLSATIRSRCRRLDVRQPSLHNARTWLMAESGADESTATAALRASSGSAPGAKKLLDLGLGDQFARLDDGLGRLINGHASIGELIDNAGETAPELLWTWLSLSIASRVRQEMGGEDGPRLSETSSGYTRRLSDLQQQADRNRRLLATSVRKDLLLRDWLIQCSQLRCPSQQKQGRQQ